MVFVLRVPLLRRIPHIFLEVASMYIIGQHRFADESSLHPQKHQEASLANLVNLSKSTVFLKKTVKATSTKKSHLLERVFFWGQNLGFKILPRVNLVLPRYHLEELWKLSSWARSNCCRARSSRRDTHGNDGRCGDIQDGPWTCRTCPNPAGRFWLCWKNPRSAKAFWWLWLIHLGNLLQILNLV